MWGKLRLQQTFRPLNTAVKILCAKCIEDFKGFQVPPPLPPTKRASKHLFNGMLKQRLFP